MSEPSASVTPCGAGKRLTDTVFDSPRRRRGGRHTLLLGVLKGEGIGPDVVDAALTVLEALAPSTDARFEIRYGGAIGTQAENLGGRPLTHEVTQFCANVFDEGGAILAGPGGGRFVYDLRKHFELFCKFAPLKISPALVRANRLKPEHVAGLDILVVRENSGGIYQGTWSARQLPGGTTYAEQTFGYGEVETRRIITVAARAAAQRRGELAVIVKDGGVPTLSELWRECGLAIAADTGVRASFVNVDLAAYQLVQEPRRFDVVVCPNLFGDVLADLGAVLLGSRGLSYSGNFSACGRAVCQTNHGAGYDLVGRGIANPAAQIFSLAMLLRESFGLDREATLIEHAVETVWSQGWRTFDLPENGCSTIGTREMTERIAGALARSVLAATG